MFLFDTYSSETPRDDEARRELGAERPTWWNEEEWE